MLKCHNAGRAFGLESYVISLLACTCTPEIGHSQEVLSRNATPASFLLAMAYPSQSAMMYERTYDHLVATYDRGLRVPPTSRFHTLDTRNSFRASWMVTSLGVSGMSATNAYLRENITCSMPRKIHTLRSMVDVGKSWSGKDERTGRRRADILCVAFQLLQEHGSK